MILTRLTRRGSASRIWNSKPGIACTTSPRTGIRPSDAKTRPPSVSTSSSCSRTSKSGPTASAISSSSTRASAMKTSSELRANITSSSSCSSSMSPTTISTMSSSDTRPSVPPYSSMTRAIWMRAALHALHEIRGKHRRRHEQELPDDPRLLDRLVEVNARKIETRLLLSGGLFGLVAIRRRCGRRRRWSFAVAAPVARLLGHIGKEITDVDHAARDRRALRCRPAYASDQTPRRAP